MLSRKLVKADSKNVVTNGLVGYWHYLKGFGSAKWDNISPSTLGSFNGVVNGATLQADGVYFDGVNDNVSIPPLNFTGDFTLELFIAIQSGANILGNSKGDSTFRLINFTLGGNIRIGLTVLADLPIISSTGVMRYISIRYNSTTKTVNAFLEGVLVGNVTNVNFVTPKFSDFSIFLGSFDATSTYSNIKIASCKMYSRMLTDTEIFQNYDARLDLGI